MIRRNFEGIVGTLLFILSFIINTYNFSELQRINTSYNKINNFDTLKNTVFELSGIIQYSLIAYLTFIVAILFIFLAILRRD